MTMNSLDKCRLACGGAGYQSNSGFTEIFSQTSPVQTYEGDNTVMLLQASRFVFKLYAKAIKGETLGYPFEYLNKRDSLLAIQGKGKSIEEVLDLEVLEGALAVRALVQVIETFKAI